MFQRVVIVEKALLCVEWRVDIGEIHFPLILGRKLGQSRKTRQGIEGVAPDEQIITHSRRTHFA
jgi:hypothetical protein